MIVFDLRGPKGQVHPVGKWLADQVSAAIRNQYPKIKTVDRSLLVSEGETSGAPMNEGAIFESEIQQTRSVGADVAITGNFAAVSNQIEVSLSVVSLADVGTSYGLRTGLIPISKEIADLMTEPIPALELKDGVPSGGKGGIGMPGCIHCPAPTEAPRSGVVILQVVVTSDGRPERIKVMSTPDSDLAAIAVGTVQAWRFKPVLGFDGNPIAVSIPIQITFARH